MVAATARKRRWPENVGWVWRPNRWLRCIRHHVSSHSSFLNVSQETQDRRTGLSLRRQVFPRQRLHRGTPIPLPHQLADPKKNHFVDAYYPTIESTFAKSVTYKGVEYDCHIIDTAGQDEYSPLNSQHAIGIHGYVLVYSITSRNSFNMIQIVYDKIIDFCGVTELPCVIVGSKCDLLQKSVRLPHPAQELIFSSFIFSRQVDSIEGQRLAEANKAIFLESSAKENVNVGKSFNHSP